MRIEVGKTSLLVKLGDTTHVRVSIDSGVNDKQGQLTNNLLDIDGHKPNASLLTAPNRIDKWSSRIKNIEERISQVEEKLVTLQSSDHKTALKQEIKYVFESNFRKEFESRIMREVRKERTEDIQEATAVITEAISVLSLKTDERMSVVEKEVLNIGSKNHSNFITLIDKIKDSESELVKTFALVARKEALDILKEHKTTIDKLELDRNKETLLMNRKLNDLKSQIIKERDKNSN